MLGKGISLKQKLIGKISEYMVKSITSKPTIATMNKRLEDCKVAFITTAGVHLADDRPFNVKGDHTFRVIPGDTDFKNLTITHDHYDKSEAMKDINCVFPLEVLRELSSQEYIKDVSSRHFGLMGYIPEAKLLIEETAPSIANMLEEDGVDIALLSPG